METKHTPGEWRYSHRLIDENDYATQVYDENGGTIATIAWNAKPPINGIHNGNPVKIYGTYREANAKLIAAAPELLTETIKVAVQLGWVSSFEALEKALGFRPTLEDLNKISKTI